MYHLFAGDHYEACGGAGDHRGSFKTLEAAIYAGNNFANDGSGCRWAHIADGAMKIVWEYKS